MFKVRAKRGSNIAFIVRFLLLNPGAGSVRVRRALASHNNKEWKPGLYCWYFNTAARSRAWGYGFNCGVDLGLWEKVNNGWQLTEKGRDTLVG